MRLSNRLRSGISGFCHTLGAVWAVAALLRLVFGVAVTFPLLPPLDLVRVHVVPAFAASLALFLVGALIGRVRPEELLQHESSHRPALREADPLDQRSHVGRTSEPVHTATKEP